MSQFSYLDANKLKEMLYDDDKYIREFAEAAQQSFSEFREDYQRHLLERNEELLRRAGHKIKPVAQMLGVDEIVEEYEHAKELLFNEEPRKKLRESTRRINKIVEGIKQDLKNLL